MQGIRDIARLALLDLLAGAQRRLGQALDVVIPVPVDLVVALIDAILGPIEKALVGTPVYDTSDPVELGHVTRSFDACIVCTVHAYDGKTGKELSKFVINGMV